LLDSNFESGEEQGLSNSNLESSEERYALRIGALDSIIPSTELSIYIALLAGLSFWNPARSKGLPNENQFYLAKFQTLKIHRN
jgi:hypothetical protein